MDRVIIERKLDSLHRSLSRVVAKRPVDVATLTSDIGLQDVLSASGSRSSTP